MVQHLVKLLSLSLNWMVTCQACDKININHPDNLQEYKSAIQFVFKTFKPCVDRQGNRCRMNKRGLIPNPLYNRTPKYIYLETTNGNDEPEKVERLFTPFGGIDLCGRGWLKAWQEASSEFFDAMRPHWVLRDVTAHVKRYFVGANSEGQEVFYGPYKYSTPLYKSSRYKNHLYLIEEINRYRFMENDALSLSELVVYYSSLGSRNMDQIINERKLFIDLCFGQGQPIKNRL